MVYVLKVIEGAKDDLEEFDWQHFADMMASRVLWSALIGAVTTRSTKGKMTRPSRAKPMLCTAVGILAYAPCRTTKKNWLVRSFGRVAWTKEVIFYVKCIFNGVISQIISVIIPNLSISSCTSLYRQISNIRHKKYQSLNVSCFVLQFPFLNPFPAGTRCNNKVLT